MKPEDSIEVGSSFALFFCWLYRRHAQIYRKLAYSPTYKNSSVSLNSPPRTPPPFVCCCACHVLPGRSSFVTLDCALTPFRDVAPGQRSWEPVVLSDCVFRVEACLDRHDATKANISQQHIDPGSTYHKGLQPVSLASGSRHQARVTWLRDGVL